MMTTDITRIPLRTATLEDMESEIAALHSRRGPSPVILEAAIPDDVGRLTAESAQAQIEATAKVVEAMSGEAREQDAKLEASRQELNEALKMIEKAAAHLRDKGKEVYTRIEAANATSKAIRDACVEVMKKADTL